MICGLRMTLHIDQSLVELTMSGLFPHQTCSAKKVSCVGS